RQKSRVTRNLVLEAQAAEPAVRQIHLHLAAQQPLGSDSEDIADDEHPDHEHQVNRRAPDRRIVGRELGTNPVKIQDASNVADKMIVRNNLLKPERVEQLTLVPIEPPHHGLPPPPIAMRRRNHCSRKSSTDFCNKICHIRTWISGAAPSDESL